MIRPGIQTVGLILAALFVLPARPETERQVKIESEPNNNRATAVELRIGESIEGYFNTRTDTDYYKLVDDRPGKRLVRIEVSAVPGVDITLSLENAEGLGLCRINDNPRGEPEILSYITIPESAGYLRIQGNEQNLTQKYVLSTTVIGPWEEGMEEEPNDRQELANDIPFGGALRCRLNAKRDEDWFKVTIPEPGPEIVIFRISGVPEDRWNFDLLDAKGKRLDRAATMDTGEGEEIVKMKVRPGTYFIQASTRDRKKSGAEYTLRVGRPEKPPASPEEVRQALVKALDFLASKQEKDGSWRDYKTAHTGMSIMAFIGAPCSGKDYAANLKAAVGYLKSRATPRSKFPAGSQDADLLGGQMGSAEMYQHAIGTLGLIEALVHLNDTSLEPIARDALQLILRSQNTEHKPETLKGPVKPDSPAYGSWRYRADNIDGDLSVTGWQVLALKAGANAGFPIPEGALPAAARFVRSLHGAKDGSFLYVPGGDSGDSCGRAGMGVLSLQLAGFPDDPLIPGAIRFMQDHAPRWIGEQPGDGFPFYYWYYGTRAMLVAGGEDWRIWKDWICRFLVDHQKPDGSWRGVQREANLEVYRTALGAMMLEFCCGHLPVYLSAVQRAGEGSLLVEFETGAEKEPAQNVEIIFDASNSMTGTIGRETKIAVAKRTLIRIIGQLPEAMAVGFRVYGHRFPTDDYQNACRDTELVWPIGPVEKARLVEVVNKVETKGRTPLVLSVLEAVKDFAGRAGGSIILLTDGIESCNGDIRSVAPAIAKSGLDLRLHVVGFDIREKEARAQLESMAQSTAGRYLDAANALELLEALQRTLQPEYEVLDAKKALAGRGTVGGEAVKIPEGTYTLRIRLAPRPVEIRVAVRTGDTSRVVLAKKEGAWVPRIRRP